MRFYERSLKSCLKLYTGNYNKLGSSFCKNGKKMSFELSSISQAKVCMSKVKSNLLVSGCKFPRIFCYLVSPRKLNGLLEQPNQL